MHRIRRFLTVLMVLASVRAGTEAQAGYVSINLNPYTNENFRLSPYQTVSNLPTGGTTITVGSTPFALATYNGQAGTTGVVQTGPFDGGSTAPTSVDIAVNIAGAVEVDTLINSTYGTLNQVSGQIQFLGTGGAFASFDLVQGVNIRDYNVGSVFNNTIAAGTNTVTYSGGTTAGGTSATRLDEQAFILPASFAGQTLTTIRLVNASTFVLNGEPFLAAATAVVPEPGSATLIGIAAALGLGGLARVRTGVARA